MNSEPNNSDLKSEEFFSWLKTLSYEELIKVEKLNRQENETLCQMLKDNSIKGKKEIKAAKSKNRDKYDLIILAKRLARKKTTDRQR